VIKFLSQINSGARVRVAASHIRAGEAVDVMVGLARRGAALEIIAESTLRRVTPQVEQRLASAGIRFRRIMNSEHLPMHLKFVLVEDNGKAWSIFGSFNWTKPSFRLNHEIAAISSDTALFQAFARRWDVLRNERSCCAPT
jgi:phosphatidylserine/phosphatidylglycerophosphate/cardiolipin synthase-like enzyme